MLCEVNNKMFFVLFRDVWMGILVDGLMSFYVGFVVFFILGFMVKDVGFIMEEIFILVISNNMILCIL